MKKLFHLIITDLKSILRDRTLSLFLMLPVVLIFAFKYIVHFLLDTYPELADYSSVIAMFAAIQTSIMFGFITSFLILDEKDENVLQVIRVLPISSNYFIIYRLWFSTVFSIVSAFITITFTDIANPGWEEALLLALQYGLIAPLITLLIGTYAKNKVEGMAYFKALDLVLMLPLAAFFIAPNLSYILAIIPTFWLYKAYEGFMTTNGMWFYVAGLVFFLGGIIFLMRQFRIRVFNR